MGLARLDDQRLQPSEVVSLQLLLRAGLFFKASREPEFRPKPHLALKADRAVHPLDQFLADGQAQARPAESPAGAAIGLREWLEQPPLRFSRNAHTAVFHRYAERRVSVILANQTGMDANFAALRELNRIAKQVQNDLAQPRGIAA
jgi:hypothetical protein